MVQTPDYLTLLAEADKIFKTKWPEAITFSAQGQPETGVAKTSSDLTNWSFLAQTDEATAELLFENGAWGSPSIVGHWLGLQFLPLPQGTLSLDEGIAALNNAGFTDGFSDVSMGTPVYYEADPMYWFCIERMTQGISAETGKYYPNLMPCNSGHPGHAA